MRPALSILAGFSICQDFKPKTYVLNTMRTNNLVDIAYACMYNLNMPTTKTTRKNFRFNSQIAAQLKWLCTILCLTETGLIEQLVSERYWREKVKEERNEHDDKPTTT